MRRAATVVAGLAGLVLAFTGTVETSSAQCVGPGCSAQRSYGQNRSFYSPKRFTARPRLHQSPNGTGLRYFRFSHPYDDYDYYRRTYPHTFDGQFGNAPSPRDLTLRFRVHPGFSPFSRYHHEDALFGDGAAAPEPAPEADEYESGAVRSQGVQRTPRRPQPPRVAPAPRLEVQHVVPRRVSRSGQPSAAEKRAWSALAADTDRAEDDFASLALAYPGHSRPKAGYALARAAQGDDDTAIWNMRRALRVDSAALREVPLTPQLEAKLRALLTRYTESEEHELSAADATFMSATLHLLLGEADAARTAARTAFKEGDRDASVLRLLLLLREQGTKQRTDLSA